MYQKLAHSSAKWAELIMAIQIVKFQAGNTKFEKLLPKNERRRFDSIKFVHFIFAVSHFIIILSQISPAIKKFVLNRPGICVKYFLLLPQKNLSPEKTETN